MTTDTTTATHLVSRFHDDGELADSHERKRGECCFCGVNADGIGVDDAVNHTYFSDYNLMQADTGHVCKSCAYCMNQRGLKQGHWIAFSNGYESVSTGDLLDAFRGIRDGEYEPPLAVHVSENPIRSEHAYLWTPVVETTTPLTLTYSRQTVRLHWDEFDRVLNAVEELRWHGFRGDDIRSGEPRLQNLQSIGKTRYRELDGVIDPHRGTPLLDVVWTLSRSRDDQPNAPDSAQT